MKMHLKEAIDAPQDTHMDTHVRSNKQMKYTHTRVLACVHTDTHIFTCVHFQSHTSISVYLALTPLYLSLSRTHTHTLPLNHTAVHLHATGLLKWNQASNAIAQTRWPRCRI